MNRIDLIEFGIDTVTTTINFMTRSFNFQMTEAFVDQDQLRKEKIVDLMVKAKLAIADVTGVIGFHFRWNLMFWL